MEENIPPEALGRATQGALQIAPSAHTRGWREPENPWSIQPSIRPRQIGSRAPCQSCGPLVLHSAAALSALATGAGERPVGLPLDREDTGAAPSPEMPLGPPHRSAGWEGTEVGR